MGAVPVPMTAMPPAERRRIPYDYLFRFQMTGVPQTPLSATVRVSVEADFVAVSIGYGFIPKVDPLPLPVKAEDFVAAQKLALEARPTAGVVLGSALNAAISRLRKPAQTGEARPAIAEVLRHGFRINPDVALSVMGAGPANPVSAADLERLFEVVAQPPEEIRFLYALFDQGTGRAFQSEPLLNTAGLGDSKGERPFRNLAAPIVFAPRTVIKMEVTELTTVKGELYVSLHGYKVLGGVGTPTGPAAPAAMPPGPGLDRMRRRRRPS